VRFDGDVEVAEGTTGETGSGVYSVGQMCESASREVVDLLAELRDDGTAEKAWHYTESEFRGIVGFDGGI
jgi:hypothetical protein